MDSMSRSQFIPTMEGCLQIPLTHWAGGRRAQAWVFQCWGRDGTHYRIVFLAVASCPRFSAPRWWWYQCGYIGFLPITSDGWWGIVIGSLYIWPVLTRDFSCFPDLGLLSAHPERLSWGCPPCWCPPRVFASSLLTVALLWIYGTVLVRLPLVLFIRLSVRCWYLSAGCRSTDVPLP